MKLKHILIALYVSLTLSYCTPVKVVPTESPIAKLQVQQLEDSVASIYHDIYSSTDKSFPTYSDRYDAAIAQIDNIIRYDSTRDKPKVILTIAHDIKDRLVLYRSKHKFLIILGYYEAIVYDDEMHNIIETLKTSENNYK